MEYYQDQNTSNGNIFSSSCKIPIEIRRDFTAESDHAEAQLEKLKDWLKSQSMEIYEKYVDKLKVLKESCNPVFCYS